MTAIIEINGLTKKYGDLTALNDLNLSIHEGEVFGFIGPNGAGKTTTMRILTTLLKPSGGSATIGGYSISEQPQEVRRMIGYMPDFFGVYDDMKVWEYLDFFAACYGIPSADRQGMIGDLLALVDLTHKRDEYVESLSRGMKQRLCLARTLAHDPQVLILDEPASGLDPRARIEMRELLRALQGMGKTIFFSSHILSEVADICTSIGIMESGRMVTYGQLEDMRRQLKVHRLIQVRIIGETVPLKDILINHPEVAMITDGREIELTPDVVQFDFTGDDKSLSSLLKSLISQEIQVISFTEKVGDLEDVFMQATAGNNGENGVVNNGSDDTTNTIADGSRDGVEEI
ncbi:MAG: ABC transporter ATP-binding protein [Ardenticatenaceae bacterium]|nr:ABC transporter ATP-binding protein [Ardenticatenaceae bacterium]